MKADERLQTDVIAELRWESVRCLSGVSGVSNEIVINSRVSADVVKADIEAALKRRAMNDAKQITVCRSGVATRR